MRVLFWSAVASLAYSYVGFPLLVLVRGRLRPLPHRAADIEPTVSVVICAYNEAATIGRKLETVLEADYPPGRLEILVASDGSTDGTEKVAGMYSDRGVRVLPLPRVGKAAALRSAVDASTGEILVLTDANSLLGRGALRALVRSFADAHVGGVAGNQVYGMDEAGQSAARGERAYWDLDRALKVAESRAGNVIAATGSIYAIRRCHFRPIPGGVTDDFFLSLAVIDDGGRLVFEPSAVAFEEVAESNATEYRRRVRIMTRGLRCLAYYPRLFDPRRHGFYAIELLSHKLLMRVMAVPLAALAVSSASLWQAGRLYRLAALGQVAGYALALLGLGLRNHDRGRSRILSLPAYFLLVQLASLHALSNLVRGRQYDRWRPTRSSAMEAPEGQMTVQRVPSAEFGPRE